MRRAFAPNPTRFGASKGRSVLEASSGRSVLEDASPEPETPAEAPAPVQQAEAAQGLPAPVSATPDFAVQGTPPAAREKKLAERHAPSARRPAAPAAAPDAMADLEKLLQELEMPTGGLAGDAPPEDGGGTLDIFAGMGEPEMAVAGLDNDLNGIDGGGLPSSTPVRKSTPKPRR